MPKADRWAGRGIRGGDPWPTGRIVAWLLGTDLAGRAGDAAGRTAEAAVRTGHEFTADSQEALRFEASNTPMAAQAPGISASGAHVLVVDDEPAITDLLSTALRLVNGLTTKHGERWASTWSNPFWASSSRTKIAVLSQ